MVGLNGIRYAPQIAAAAARHHVDPRLLAAVAAQETGGPSSDSGNNIVGDGGHGHGIFQIDDRWHAFANTPSAADPAANADYAAGMLEDLLQRYGGNVRAALSAYNAGSPGATGTVTEWPDGARLGYADSVLQHLSRIEGAGDIRSSAYTSDVGASGTADGAGGSSSPIGAPSGPAPVATIPTDQSSLQPFRSFASELQTAGAACEDADRRMASLLDPNDAGGDAA